METEALLKVAESAAQSAGEILLKYFRNSHLNTVRKSDGSPVTNADKEAEVAITQYISDAFPTHSFIGEEFGRRISKDEYTWIIDPIDGTRYFARGMPYFTIEIAVLHRGTIEAAVSFAPALDQLLTAMKGKGSYLNHSQQLQVSTTNLLENSFVSAGSVKHFAAVGHLENLAKLNSAVGQLRGLEEARMYRLVADGTIDAAIMAKGFAWDFAAAQLILEEAGAKVTNLDGQPLDYSSKQNLTFLVANPLLHPKLLTFFQK